MVSLKIESFLKIDGEWMEQKKVPEEEVEKIVEDTMKKAGMSIGAEIKIEQKRRRAGNKKSPAV